MWAIFLILGQVWATATAQVTPSADCMLVIRKMWCGLGTALSQRKAVQPATKIVRHRSSSATGRSAGVVPVKKVMWPILYGASGMLPLGLSCAWATPTDGMTDPADAVSAAPTLTPRVLRKSRRFTSPAMVVPPLDPSPWDRKAPR